MAIPIQTTRQSLRTASGEDSALANRAFTSLAFVMLGPRPEHPVRQRSLSIFRRFWILGTEPYDIHTSWEEPVLQGIAIDPGRDNDLGDLSQQPAASTDDFSPWGRRCPKGG